MRFCQGASFLCANSYYIEDYGRLGRDGKKRQCATSCICGSILQDDG